MLGGNGDHRATDRAGMAAETSNTAINDNAFAHATRSAEAVASRA